ncbi:MAG TPA: DUF3857 domain-containing protein [Agriterribacter sp.]|nr:DUF3857 domain-containing protein [Agriterribacter sp.]HRQ50499.1 DUF3857 domain-containing protein [Agriterribacter sp.]
MILKIWATVTFLLGAGCVFANDGDYAVDKIPGALLKNAHVVKRMEDIRFEVLDLGKSRLYHKYALTILNENGDKYAMEVVGYDKLREFKSMEGNLYDANGKKIRSLKKSEIKDLSATDDISLMDDNRIKVHGFFHRLYPYTVEYETVVQFNCTYFFPLWDPVDNEKIAVMQSAITVVAPADFPVRYKAFNYTGEPEIKTEKGNKVYHWEIKDFEPIELEYAYPAWDYLVPMVYLAPAKFEIEKYQGDMSTWKGLGKFIYTLNQGRDKLPENIKQVVHQLADPVSDPKEKIARLYNYMQQNTRYISIQLGIGGLQPFDAAYVAARKYGDCKALSNYMYSLLKEAGIKSYYTLVKSGEGKNYFREDFPSDQFNHIILCVPLQKDTVWLECTSQTAPAGYLSGFTSNRPVLLVDEDGGKLVKTPHYGIDQNLQIRTASGQINDEGLLTININTRYRAMQQDDLHFLVNGYSHEKQLEYLKRGIDLPHYDVVKFEYKETKSALPVINEILDLTALNYASITGKRLFITPNIISRSSSKLKPDDKRKYPVSLNYEYRDIDTAVIEIPSGYTVENMPAPIKIESKFGKYSASVNVQADKIIYYRSIEKFSGQFPPSDYNDLVKFFDQIYKADRSRVVLVKKEG